MMVTNSILGGIADTTAQTITAIRQRALRKQASGQSPSREEDPVAVEIHELDRKNPLQEQDLIPESRLLPPPFDFERLTRFMGYGFLMAPIQFKWFKLLERIFDKPGIGETPDSADEPPADLGEGVSPSSPISSNARYTSGIQVEVNLLMPDRYAGPSCRPSRDVWLNAKPLSGPWICNLSRRDQQKCRCRNALTR